MAKMERHDATYLYSHVIMTKELLMTSATIITMLFKLSGIFN